MPCLRGSARPRSPLALIVTGCLAAGCGSAPSTPSGSPTHTPTATPSGAAGVVAGRYLLQILRDRDCNMPVTALSFPMGPDVPGSSRHPVVQVLLYGEPCAMELKSQA